jgi:hypothetical protein
MYLEWTTAIDRHLMFSGLVAISPARKADHYDFVGNIVESPITM